MTLPGLAQAPQRQTLRPYQAEALDQLRARISAGVKRLLLVVPTGGGKTTIAAEMVHGARSRGLPVLFLAHRKELIDQASARLDQFQVPHGVIMAGHRRHNPMHAVQVASVQTLARRQKPPAALVIVDEAHHARARTYQQILDHYPSAPVIGLTATPWRTDGKGLGELFAETVAPAGIRELTEEGYLVPATGWAFDVPEMSRVKKRAGEYDQRGMELAMGSSVISGHIVEYYLSRSAGLRAVLFAASVKHSLDLTERFRAAGVRAEHLDGTTEKNMREAILDRLASGETQLVSNVGVLTEGWDCPAVEVCILARPTLSTGLYMQMVGRVLRPAPGKSQARIHDHAGCILQHGLPDDPRDYSLSADVSQQREPTETMGKIRQCGGCYVIWRPVGNQAACPECGWVAPARAPKIVNTGIQERSLDEIRDARAVAQALVAQALQRKRNTTEPERREEYVRLLRQAQARGYKPGWAAIRFKEAFGYWPPKSYSQEAA